MAKDNYYYYSDHGYSGHSDIVATLTGTESFNTICSFKKPLIVDTHSDIVATWHALLCQKYELAIPKYIYYRDLPLITYALRERGDKLFYCMLHAQKKEGGPNSMLYCVLNTKASYLKLFILLSL